MIHETLRMGEEQDADRECVEHLASATDGMATLCPCGYGYSGYPSPLPCRCRRWLVRFPLSDAGRTHREIFRFVIRLRLHRKPDVPSLRAAVVAEPASLAFISASFALRHTMPPFRSLSVGGRWRNTAFCQRPRSRSEYRGGRENYSSISKPRDRAFSIVAGVDALRALKAIPPFLSTKYTNRQAAAKVYSS